LIAMPASAPRGTSSWISNGRVPPTAVHRFDLRLGVNGQRRQTGNTRTMIFGVGEIGRYLSQFMVPDPGDIINTGTPPGVALGMPDTPYQRAGDVVEPGISGLGRQRQRFMAAP
jgi:2-keto-4-pentenoate hydratase/2-oxohepta-3-ene-1,7-dioic acid hydratase in catechol pathway